MLSAERLPMGQPKFLAGMLSCFRFALMCVRQVGLRSTCSPRYLSPSPTGAGWLKSVRDGQVPFRREKMTCAGLLLSILSLDVYIEI